MIQNQKFIQICNLQKVYTIHEREAGLGAAVRSLFRRQTRDIRAVDGISFDVHAGEIVGFLGPNGAGKTTTLKMLSGLLHPTGGEVDVLGFTPWQREKAFLRQITLVMGQRNQLVWDIPAIDSFELNRVIYHIPEAQYRETLKELVELLELEALIHKPVRNLSLGERMKCEIAGALLHRPRVLFLDEPTIGLDVTAQRRIREFVAEYNRRHGAAVLLTSHYMADVEALCRRVIVIHHGRLLFDGALADLVQRFSPHKTILVKLAPGATNGRGAEALRPFGEVISYMDGQAELRVPKGETAVVTSRLLATFPIHDLTVQDPPIEEVIEQVFTKTKQETADV
ncbi:MAG: ATP-binding cassette domain-containing protein [Chloroflexi bacterium]|nr:MAG: ATP-binding cassette domain-containing protein [Chloroflexota bacterium]